MAKQASALKMHANTIAADTNISEPAVTLSPALAVVSRLMTMPLK
jgi:hypothetical protein